jgi:hypothetical protein
VIAQSTSDGRTVGRVAQQPDVPGETIGRYFKYLK